MLAAGMGKTGRYMCLAVAGHHVRLGGIDMALIATNVVCRAFKVSRLGLFCATVACDESRLIIVRKIAIHSRAFESQNRLNREVVLIVNFGPCFL